MEEYIKYIIVAIYIIALDLGWIFLNYNMYKNLIKSIQKSEFNPRTEYIIPAYIFIAFTFIYVAIPFTKHYLKSSDTWLDKLYKSLIYGGAVGLASYGIFSFTNIVIFKEYPLYIAIIDTLWGSVIGTTSVFLYTLLE
jgi:uncharacterized membrane protein